MSGFHGFECLRGDKVEQTHAAGRTLKVRAALKRRVGAQLDLLKDLTPCTSHVGFTLFTVIFASESWAPWEHHGVERLESGFTIRRDSQPVLQQWVVYKEGMCQTNGLLLALWMCHCGNIVSTPEPIIFVVIFRLYLKFFVGVCAHNGNLSYFILRELYQELHRCVT